MWIVGPRGGEVRNGLVAMWDKVKQRATLLGDPGRRRPGDPTGLVVVRRNEPALQIGLEVIQRGDPRFDEILNKSYFTNGDLSQINWVTPRLTIKQFEKLIELAPNKTEGLVPGAENLLQRAREIAKREGGNDNSPMPLLIKEEKQGLARLLFSGEPKIYMSGAWSDFYPDFLQNCCHDYPGNRNDDLGFGVAGT